MTEATQSQASRGARPGNSNALRHGLFTREAVEARRVARAASLSTRRADQYDSSV